MTKANPDAPPKTFQTGFALHQLKRGEDYRSHVIAPPGYSFVEFDAAGQEFKWMAIASRDETMLNLCLPGEDAHSYMGSRISSQWGYEALMKAIADGDKYAKPIRQIGKVGNLSLQYRTSAKKLRSVSRLPPYEIPMTLNEAQLIWKVYRQTYPGVPIYWENQISQTKRNGYVETLAGRRVQVVGNWDGDWGWSMGSTAINYRIQGTGADQKYLALALLKEYLLRVGAYFGWDMHDGLYLVVPDHLVDKVAVEGKYLLDNLPYTKAWDFTPPIPLPWDCKTGKSWGGLRDYRYT